MTTTTFHPRTIILTEQIIDAARVFDATVDALRSMHPSTSDSACGHLAERVVAQVFDARVAEHVRRQREDSILSRMRRVSWTDAVVTKDVDR